MVSVEILLKNSIIEKNFAVARFLLDQGLDICFNNNDILQHCLDYHLVESIEFLFKNVNYNNRVSFYSIPDARNLFLIDDNKILAYYIVLTCYENDDLLSYMEKIIDVNENRMIYLDMAMEHGDEHIKKVMNRFDYSSDELSNIKNECSILVEIWNFFNSLI